MGETGQNGKGSNERADAVIVGARCAGSAAAATLARAGRKVIVLDRASFPSDTLSTHLMFPSSCAEAKRVGAWPEIEKLNPARMHWLRVTINGDVDCKERIRAVEGIDYSVSIPRTKFDICLVENARRQGADVREHCPVEDVLWRAGRACGVTYRDADGNHHTIETGLVIGADGRKSTVAARVGAWRPYRASRNGRGLIFRYMDDPMVGTEAAETLWQWRDGRSFALAFPNPEGRLLILFMPDAAEVAEARSDPEAYWQRKLDQHPGMAARTEGATKMTKLRSSGDVSAFFRPSSGPGWALAGDAGHFKDPVIGQGMRDAMWMGRTLGEQLAEHLDDPVATDRATRAWERDRDRECLPAYHLANTESEVQDVPPVVSEAFRHFGQNTKPEIGDVFQRVEMPADVLTWPVLVRALGSGVRRAAPGTRLATLRAGLVQARTEFDIRREIAADKFRAATPISGSERTDYNWWPPPRPPRQPQAPSGEAGQIGMASSEVHR